ncbi:MAG: hypothetical protein MH252_22080 [Thermosynechococcaceae cyanobacterium MS004]|nr:hypothetical protein [Thermosynechococcaceae cyanobacterium MS004]
MPNKFALNEFVLNELALDALPLSLTEQRHPNSANTPPSRTKRAARYRTKGSGVE